MTDKRLETAAVGAVALMLVAAGFIFLYAPTDALQGPVQRIFYLHVSSAIAAYGCFAVVLLGGIVYLWKENATRRSTRTCRGGGGPCFHDGDVGDGHDLGETDLGHVLDLGRAPHIDPRALDHLCGLPDGSQARRARPPGRTFCRRGRHL